jgi:hypothetical protein
MPKNMLVRVNDVGCRRHLCAQGWLLAHEVSTGIVFNPAVNIEFKYFCSAGVAGGARMLLAQAERSPLS